LTSLGWSKNIEVSTLHCQTESFWEYGRSLINYMKQEDTEGISGRIKLDDSGLRTYFDLDIVELQYEGFRTIGSWNPMIGAKFSSQVNKRDTSFLNKDLVVSTILNHPFVMLKEDHETHKGNDRYEGYNVDLLKEISQIVGFKYTIKLVEDGKYGQYDEQRQQWSGLIGELQSQKADLVIADLTITSKRSKVIDFTTPFMNTGITILFKKETYEDTSGLFTLFLSPFELDLWLCILAAYFAISLVLYLIARFNPVEVNSKPTAKNEEESTSRPEEPVHLANERESFTAMNSFWFILASGLAQRVDFLPRAFSTRLIAAVWWFFVIIMISSYIANLVSFLNYDHLPTEEEKIESVSDLITQEEIQYGTVEGGSTAAFFRDSYQGTYMIVWDYMNNTDNNAFVQSTHEGVERVLNEKGKYAFFVQSWVVDYLVERRCDLKQVGGLLDNKGYGIGLPKNSPYYDQINRAVLQLKENGKLERLKRKWWLQKRGGGACAHSVHVGPRGPISLDSHDLGGIFVLLAIGILLACIIRCGEYLFIWWKKRNSNEA